MLINLSFGLILLAPHKYHLPLRETAMQIRKRPRTPSWKAQRASQSSTTERISGEQMDSPQELQDAGVNDTQSGKQDVAEKPRSASVMSPSAALPLAELPLELLQTVMHHLRPGELMRLSLVSGSFAAACEGAFMDICRRHRWSYPRRPRGPDTLKRAFPWRHLYRQHACRACGNYGEFVTRHVFNAPHVQPFLLCKPCTQAKGVQIKLISLNMTVDTIGLSGKNLLRKRPKHKSRRGR